MSQSDQSPDHPIARPPDSLTVSVVINTYNRAAALETTLNSLRRLNYPHFEAIVVNGPSPDNTLEVLQAHASSVRVGTCTERNLSVSRNVGIEMARGDIVAFLDDDAVPDENWLDDIVAGFDTAEVAGVGGFVYDHTGYTLQYRYSLCNRMGNARWNVSFPGGEFCYPGAVEFPYLQGTNAAFRRDALLEVGGFDEEFDYYLDETDLCLRLIDAGYLIRQIPNAFVYHRFLPSHIREATRVVSHWRPIIKNKIYFALKSCPPGTSFRALMEDWRQFTNESEAGLRYHIQHGNAPAERLEQFHRDADLALREGMERGLSGARRFMQTEIARQLRGTVAYDVLDHGRPGTFKPCPTLMPKSDKLTICYLSQEYPPGIVGGIGRLTRDLAAGLAERGHNVHVLTRSATPHNTVDFENGVWVHRLVRDQVEPPPPDGIQVPAHIWQNSARLLRELKRINAAHPVDIVEGPIWDTEGIAPLVDRCFRVVTNLETPLKMWMETNPELVGGSPEEQRFFEQQAAAEKLLMEEGVAHRAISHAIVEAMEQHYGVSFRPGQVTVFPLGMEDRSQNGHAAPKTAAKENGVVNVLFTGRFEHRKGIDVLLNVIPSLCLKFPKARFTLVGEDRPRPDGTTLTGVFRSRHAKSPFRNRVIFTGQVSDRELETYLAQCDIFVAPSRYESFGLVFLEAMMFSKPVVGCRAGGMKEVIEDGVTGLLAEPGDAASLQATLATLLANPARREAMGKAGRERFLAYYTRHALTDRTLAFYHQVLESPATQAVEMPPPPAGAELVEAARA
jgi:glycogen synthase